MRSALPVMLASVITLPFLMAQEKAAPTAQTQRGREIFVNSSKGTACKTCHHLGGIGTAIGPDLTTMASYGTTHSLVATFYMKMTEHIRLVKGTDASFPAILKQKDGDATEFWDLSQIPPVLRRLSPTEIVSDERDQSWRHPPSKVDYTKQELADIIGFLRWAATGSTKEIKLSEIPD